MVKNKRWRGYRPIDRSTDQVCNMPKIWKVYPRKRKGTRGGNDGWEGMRDRMGWVGKVSYRGMGRETTGEREYILGKFQPL